jgi:hypothetical protein
MNCGKLLRCGEPSAFSTASQTGDEDGCRHRGREPGVLARSTVMAAVMLLASRHLKQSLLTVGLCAAVLLGGESRPAEAASPEDCRRFHRECTEAKAAGYAATSVSATSSGSSVYPIGTDMLGSGHTLRESTMSMKWNAPMAANVPSGPNVGAGGLASEGEMARAVPLLTVTPTSEDAAAGTRP